MTPGTLVTVPGLPCPAIFIRVNEYDKAIVRWQRDGQDMEGEIDRVELEACNNLMPCETCPDAATCDGTYCPYTDPDTGMEPEEIEEALGSAKE